MGDEDFTQGQITDDASDLLQRVLGQVGSAMGAIGSAEIKTAEAIDLITTRDIYDINTI